MSYYRNHLPIAGASGQSTGYTINQSIRFNDDDSAYLSRTHSASNKRTFTFSCWIKRGNLGGYQRLFNAVDAGDNESFIFRDDAPANRLQFYSGDATVDLKTNRLFMDTAAWYHIILNVDTTQTVTSERVRIYVNGIREESFATETYPAKDAQTAFNGNVVHEIGRSAGSGQYLDGYMAEIHFLDGYAYDSSYFGEFNDIGIWIPKKYSGSYGTNGFYIKGQSSGALGNDSSGNDNDFSSSGLAAHDQVSDSPTNNFTVMAPTMVNSAGNVARNAVFSDGNLKVTNTTTTADFVAYNMTVPASFKSYYEIYVSHSGGSGAFGGGNNNRIMVLDSESLNSSTTWAVSYNENGSATGSGESSQSPAAFEHGDIIGIAVDMSANVRYYRNGSLLFTMAVGSSYQSLGHMLVIRIMQSNSKNPTFIMNFGQDGTFAGNKTAQGNKDGKGVGNFFYSPPSGHLAICTTNLGA